MLRWPHGGHGDCASARAGYGVRRWAWPAGERIGGRFTALQRHQRRCRFEAFPGAMDCAPSVSTEARKPKTHVLHKKAVTLALWGKRHAGRQGPMRGPMGAVLGVLLRNYGFTDLPPSLPLPRSDPACRQRASTNQVTAG